MSWINQVITFWAGTRHFGTFFYLPDCATVLVSWTVPDSFIDNFFVRHTANRHTNGFRYVSVDVCSLNSYSFRSSSGAYGTVVVLRVMSHFVGLGFAR